MDLQPAIDELMTRRELIKQKLKDIDEAIPVLQRLNNEMNPPDLSAPAVKLEPVKLEPFKAEFEVKLRKIAEKPMLLPPEKANGPAAKEYVCDACHCVFNSQRGLDSHNEIHHSGQKKSFTGGKSKYPCPHCDKRFGTKAGIEEHIQLRHKEETEDVS